MLGFLEEDEIMDNEEELFDCLKSILKKGHKTKPLSRKYIDMNVDTVSLIADEIEK